MECLQSAWDRLLVLKESGNLEKAQGFCTFARHVTDALAGSEAGLTLLDDLLQPRLLDPIQQSPVETMLVTCEILMNEWLLEHLTPLQKPSAEMSQKTLQHLFGEKSTLWLAQHLLFSVKSQSATGSVAPARRLLAVDGIVAPRMQVPGSHSMFTSADSSTLHSSKHLAHLDNTVGEPISPYTGSAPLSHPFDGSNWQPREISHRNALVGGFMLQQSRRVTPSSLQDDTLCSTRFAALLKNCTSSLKLRAPETAAADSSGQKLEYDDSDIVLETGAQSWGPMWQFRQWMSAQAVVPGDTTPFGADSAYNPRSTLFSASAILDKEIFYDTNRDGSEIGTRGTPYGFFPEVVDDLKGSFTVLFPVLHCFLFYLHILHCNRFQQA